MSSLLAVAMRVRESILAFAPRPQPPCMALAALFLGPKVHLPVGLFLHVVYVTFWAVAYVVIFRDRLTFLNALWLGLALWAVILILFFPIFGW